MKVLKFGGSSVGSPEKIKDVKKIVESQVDERVVVVSAFRGITDQLVKTGLLASAGDQKYADEIDDMETRHIEAIDILVEKTRQEEIKQWINQRFDEMRVILQGVSLLHELTDRTMDLVLSFGERLSAKILSYAIQDATYYDARDFIITDNNFGGATVDYVKTQEQISASFHPKSLTVVLPGFVSSTATGETTTLGRGGSDYTAAIFASMLDATVLEIWTDVDGFMTADPRKVEKAYAVERLSYAEAMELSHFGAKVIYTPTIKPVLNKNIPLYIKNTFNPNTRGTLISNTPDEKSTALIKGISSIDEVDLITLQGAGLVGVTGISKRLFSALAKSGTNVIMITQASSEYSISFAVAPADSERAMASIEKYFDVEINQRKEIRLSVERELSIIAIVGEKMRNTPGISGTLFSSMGRNGINVIATAQGSSELNISVVVSRKSLRKALNVIHESFFLSHYKEVHVFMVGTGTVGSSLLQQMQNQQKKLLENHWLKVNVVGIANSRKMLVDEKGFVLDNYKQYVNEHGEPSDLKLFVDQMKKLNLRNSVFVDCTASEDVATIYPDVLKTYSSIVTANKIACSSDYASYKELKQITLARNVKFMFETNVGAGLPIINTMNDLLRSGDKILKLQAVLSGTLNFIFNTLSAEVSLSEAVKMAQEKGFSEPDPRIDLSGVDVLRKLLILSREAEYPMEKDDVQIKSFLPEECFKGSLDDFWQEIKKQDSIFEDKRQKLEKENKKWRFVATMDDGKAFIELMEVDHSHPAYHLEGSNNIILITTDRYRDEPLIIKGYGAGAEVTAAGVFADIIRIANV